MPDDHDLADREPGATDAPDAGHGANDDEQDAGDESDGADEVHGGDEPEPDPAGQLDRDEALARELVRLPRSAPSWLLVEAMLAESARNTLHRMVLDRTVVLHAARLHRPVWFTAAEWQCLEEDRSEREGLVHELVAEGCRQFYRSVIAGRWDRSRGAGLRVFVAVR